MQRSVRDLAVDRWQGILPRLGVSPSYLRNRHGPCPICRGGRDRFRFDNRGGRGTWICNQCGAGDAFDLLERVLGWDFKTAANEVEAIVGDVPAQQRRAEVDDETIRRERRELWQSGKPIEPGSIADRYFEARGVKQQRYPSCLRWVEHLAHPEDNVVYPAILAAFVPAGEGVATVHRTWIKPDGSGKAPVSKPRMVGRGGMPSGGAVRLYPAGEELGIGEGIETCMAAARLYQRPVWAALSAGMLAKWQPPEGVKRVAIFADADMKFGGQKAAYELAHRLAVQEGYEVRVEVPPQLGSDWLDVLTGEADAG